MRRFSCPHSTDEEVEAYPKSCSQCQSCQLKSGPSAPCLLLIFPAHLGICPGKFITLPVCPQHLPKLFLLCSHAYTRIQTLPCSNWKPLVQAKKRYHIGDGLMTELTGHSLGKQPVALGLGGDPLLWVDLNLCANILCGQHPFTCLSLWSCCLHPCFLRARRLWRRAGGQ